MADLGTGEIYTIAIAGSGKLASKLLQALQQNNLNIDFLWGRNGVTLQELAKSSNAQVVEKEFLTQIQSPCIVFLCVPDAALQDVIEMFSGNKNLLLIQMSGSIPRIQTLGHQAETAVFYPLMTFTKDRDVNWKLIPVFLETDNANTSLLLEKLAMQLGNTCRYMNAENRKSLHLAAVFANNFVNHSLAIAYKICAEGNLDFALLKPLVEETISKAFETNPALVQTGPAVRQDWPVINEHIRFLSSSEYFRNVYEANTHSIQNINI